MICSSQAAFLLLELLFFSDLKLLFFVDLTLFSFSDRLLFFAFSSSSPSLILADQQRTAACGHRRRVAFDQFGQKEPKSIENTTKNFGRFWSISENHGHWHAHFFFPKTRKITFRQKVHNLDNFQNFWFPRKISACPPLVSKGSVEGSESSKNPNTLTHQHDFLTPLYHSQRFRQHRSLQSLPFTTFRTSLRDN